MVGAGVGGLLLWLGVRGSRWLKGEFAYYRWRRQRLHSITLRARENGDGLTHHVATGAALVWDDRRHQLEPP